MLKLRVNYWRHKISFLIKNQTEMSISLKPKVKYIRAAKIEKIEYLTKKHSP